MTEEFTSSVHFTYKSVWMHLFAFLKRPTSLLITTAAVFGVFFTFAEAVIRFTNVEPSRNAYLWLAASSILVAIFWHAWLYLNAIPEGFEDVSMDASRIAHLQRPRWQFRLAKALLAEMLGPLDRELTDIEHGRSFITAEKPETFDEYFHWLQTRIPNLERMIHVAKQVTVCDFTKSLTSSADRPAEPIAVLSAVRTLSRFYSETVEFERSLRAVLPSEELKSLHQLTYGWSEPVRDAVHQLFKYLDQVIARANSSVIHFQVTVPATPQAEEFVAELQRIGHNIDALREKW